MKTLFQSLLAIVVFSLTAVTVHAQQGQNTPIARHEVDLHLLGFGYNYEFPIVDKLTLQANVNYEFSLYINSDYVNTIATLSFGLEPRFYYNLEKRIRQNKNTKYNAANFVSVQFIYLPDLFTSTNSKFPVTVERQISVAPMWNIRRNIAQSNFNYEVGLGMFYRTIYYKEFDNESSFTPNLSLKIGYNF